MRHEDELHHKIMERQIEGERSRGRPCTTLIKTIINDARLDTDLKRLTNNREEWIECGGRL